MCCIFLSQNAFLKMMLPFHQCFPLNFKCFSTISFTHNSENPLCIFIIGQNEVKLVGLHVLGFLEAVCNMYSKRVLIIIPSWYIDWQYFPRLSWHRIKQVCNVRSICLKSRIWCLTLSHIHKIGNNGTNVNSGFPYNCNFLHCFYLKMFNVLVNMKLN